MMFPSVFGENLFDEWMDDFGFRDNFFSGKNPLYGKHAKNIMKTDVRETDKGYAKFENGVLRLSIPKKAAEEIEADKYVSIEG